MPATDARQEYQINLPEFEGPLDLLLHLVKRHELSIIDIPIAYITEKYIEYIDLMRALNIDVAGEYLLMAATLAHIKSRELLPRNETSDIEDGSEDEEDPKVALIRRLLEYQRYKEVAVSLGGRPRFGRQVFGRGVPMEPVDPKDRPLAEVSTFALLSAMAEMLKRNKVRMAYEVTVDRVSITDRINELVDRLAHRDTIPFLDCFGNDGPTARHDLVVTFLAMLELCRLRMIRVLQHSTHGEIYITRTEGLHRVDDSEASFE